MQLARALPVTAAERATLLAAAVTDTQAAYTLRAEAARMSAPHPVAGASGELALPSSGLIAPMAGASGSELALLPRPTSLPMPPPNRFKWKRASTPRASPPTRKCSFACGARRWPSLPRTSALAWARSVPPWR